MIFELKMLSVWLIPLLKALTEYLNTKKISVQFKELHKSYGSLHSATLSMESILLTFAGFVTQ